MRWWFVGLTTICLAISLTACDPPPSDPIAIGLRGSHLVVVPCESIKATKIIMSIRGPNPPSDDWIDFFEVSGSIAVSAGEEFDMSAPASEIPGTTTRFTPSLKAGSDVDILFANETDAIANGAFTIDSKGMPQSGWLQWDGTVTKKPCGYHHRY